MSVRSFLYALCASLVLTVGVSGTTSDPKTERVSVDGMGDQHRDQCL